MTDDEFPSAGEFLDEYSSIALLRGHRAAWREMAAKYIDRMAFVRLALFVAAYAAMTYGLVTAEFPKELAGGFIVMYTLSLGEALMWAGLGVILMIAAYYGWDYVLP